MSTTTKTPKTTATEKVTAKVQDAREVVGDLSKALTASSKAYVSGILELSKTFGGFGREIMTESKDHVVALTKAKSLREVAERQAAFVQHRVEMSATHTKELGDLARIKTEDVITPVTDLVAASTKAA